MLSWILAVLLWGRDTNPSLWTVSFPHTFDKDSAQTVHWFPPWAADLHVGAPVCQGECLWSESMYEIVAKKSSSSWEHWPNADLSMCCSWQSPFGDQRGIAFLRLGLCIYLISWLWNCAWKYNARGYSSKNSLPIAMAISTDALSNFRISDWISLPADRESSSGPCS